MQQIFFQQPFYSLFLFLIPNGVLVVNSMCTVKVVVNNKNGCNGEYKYSQQQIKLVYQGFIKQASVLFER